MLLKLTTTHKPATDLGYLLHKHPEKLHTFDLSIGKAHVFFPEASEERCTACLLIDINPLDLVRGRAFLQEHYVNDKPYTSNSFLCTALTKALGSSINGNCQTKPELTEAALPFHVVIHSLKVDCDKSFLHKLFEPLGYKIAYETVPLDPLFASWGEAKALNLTLEATLPLKNLLTHLYVLIMALDNERHYWISRNDIEVLMKRGENWLDSHPEKDWITKRYLKNLRSLTSEALLRLTSEERVQERTEREPSLHQQRLNAGLEYLKASGAESVLDVGCGEGKLLKLLLKEAQFKKIAGMDVSFGELQKAKENLHLNDASPLMRERVSLFQSSITYKDERIKNYDAMALIEVIEHLDEERLPAMEKIVFGYARPKTVILSTPNAEYNVLFKDSHFRHDDHRFEWTRKQFSDWCAKIALEYNYEASLKFVGLEEKAIGAPSQLAVFKLR